MTALSNELARPTTSHPLAGAPHSTYQPLDHYAAGRSAAPVRREVLATLSAGYRQAPRQGQSVGLPARSDDGRIYVHGDLDRVPNLLATLAERDNKGLTITFPSDDEHEIIASFFARYSQTRLEAFGDEHQVTTIELVDAGRQDRDGKPIMQPVRHVYASAEEPERYRRVVATCKAYHRVAFYLMVWDGNTPLLDLSDGVAPYAIRTSSRHSIQSLLSAIKETKSLTGGRVAGIPFEVWIDPKREVAGPDGARRRIPVWRFATRTPRGIRLTPPVWRQMATTGLEQRELLLLPAGPTWESEAEDPTVVEPDATTVQLLEQGGRCDARFWEASWFARVRDTALGSDAGRATFLRAYTRGGTDSLATFLSTATEDQAAALLAAVGEHLGRQRTRASAATYHALFDDEDAAPPQVAHASVDTETGEIDDGEVLEEVEDAAPAPEASRAEQRDRYLALCRAARDQGIAHVPFDRVTDLPGATADLERELGQVAF